MPTVEFDDDFAGPTDYARVYRQLGLQVVPAHSPREGGEWKRPYGDWLEFQDQLTPDAVFVRWYDPETGEHRRNRQMGLVTGQASGGLLVLDLDAKPGSPAMNWWAGLVALHANDMEPETWVQHSGGGGRHLFFRAPNGWQPPTFKTPIGVDPRGQGGFIMTAPSMHASGRPYDWASGQAPWQMDLAEAPEWLIEAIEALREEYGGQSAGGRHEKTARPEGVKNAFGMDIDEREHKLQLIAWSLVVNLYRESPIPPTEAMLRAEIEAAFQRYEQTTKSRLPPVQGQTNADLLEREGRGISELCRKVRYAVRKWNGKVKEAAAEPAPERPAWGEKLNEGFSETPPPEPETDDDTPFSAGSFTGSAPVREWMVDDWIVRNAINSLYGGGGIGKSLLAQQLTYARATGTPWLGLTTRPGRTLAVFCEDDKDELHRRHDDIRTAAGHSIGNPYGNAMLWPRLGRVNIILGFERDRPILGSFHDRLLQEIDEHQADLLILDTLSDVFIGDERDRAQVNFFLKTVLGGLIRKRNDQGHDLTLLLLGHPSVSGQASKTGISGSTAWENGVRSRLFFDRPENGADDERILTRGKANYASSGDSTGLRLLWDRGVFHSLDTPDLRAVGLVRQRVVERVEWAWGMGQPYMEAKTHKRNLHRALIQELPDIARDVLLAAIREAIDDGLIVLSRNNSRRGWRTANEG